jgi:putative DNA primase/helicase
MQIVFQSKEGAPNAAGCYGKHLDGRNDGGYIVAPPSTVVEGEREGVYAWLSDPRTTALATMPDWLFEQAGQKPKSTKFSGGPKPVQEMAGDGRNNALTSLAGSLRRRDAGEDTVRAALLAENARFPTPLDESEVEAIVQSAMRNFAPEPEITATAAPHDHGMRTTDQYYAEQLALMAGDRIRFNDESGKWYAWDGRRWAMSTSNVVVRHITDMAKSLYLQASAETDADKRTRLVAAGARLESWRVVSGIVRLAQALPQLQVRADEFDPDEHLLNVENGVIDLRTGDLLPHDPKLMMSRLAPAAYDPDAAFPLWDETIRLAMQDDAEKIAFMQRALGYALTGYTSEDKFFNLVGPSGANGKTMITTAVATVLGDYATTLRVEALLAGHESAIPHDLADLRGARFVITSETPAGRRFDDRLLKMISGDDEITACFKFGNNFRYYPQFKLFMYSNHPPLVSASDEAVWRRAVTVNFNFNFRAYAGFDPKAKDRLRSPEARPGILAWLVRGALAWQESGLMIPDIIRVETAAHRLEVSEVQTFVSECCDTNAGDVEPHVWVSAQELFRSYLQWARERGAKRMSQGAFESEMKRLGFEVVEAWANRNKRQRWRGVRLRGPQE